MVSFHGHPVHTLTNTRREAMYSYIPRRQGRLRNGILRTEFGLGSQITMSSAEYNLKGPMTQITEGALGPKYL